MWIWLFFSGSYRIEAVINRGPAGSCPHGHLQTGSSKAGGPAADEAMPTPTAGSPWPAWRSASSSNPDMRGMPDKGGGRMNGGMGGANDKKEA
jgi:hypothetical protein